jgi:hypothetical protein
VLKIKLFIHDLWTLDIWPTIPAVYQKDTLPCSWKLILCVSFSSQQNCSGDDLWFGRWYSQWDSTAVQQGRWLCFYDLIRLCLTLGAPWKDTLWNAHEALCEDTLQLPFTVGYAALLGTHERKVAGGFCCTKPGCFLFHVEWVFPAMSVYDQAFCGQIVRKVTQPCFCQPLGWVLDSTCHLLSQILPFHRHPVVPAL